MVFQSPLRVCLELSHTGLRAQFSLGRRAALCLWPENGVRIDDGISGKVTLIRGEGQKPKMTVSNNDGHSNLQSVFVGSSVS